MNKNTCFQGYFCKAADALAAAELSAERGIPAQNTFKAKDYAIIITYILSQYNTLIYICIPIDPAPIF